MATTDKNQKSLAALPFWRRAAILFMNTLRWVFRTIVAVLTVLFSSLFLISAFSDFISPDYWVLSAYFGLFFPFFVFAILGWAVFLAIARRWKYLLVVGLVLLAGGIRIWRYCPIHFSKADAVTEQIMPDGTTQVIEVDSLRVLTYNTMALGCVKLNRPDIDIPIFDYIRQTGADVVCLQEYAFSSKPEGQSEKRLKEALKDIYPYYAYVNNYTRTNCGSALFSKYPITRYERIDTKKYFGSAAYGELDLKGRKLALVNCYLQSYQIPNKERSFMNEMGKHFEADSLERLGEGLRRLGDAYRHRALQARLIREFVDKQPDIKNTPLLILGDMNDTPISFTYSHMSEGLSDTWMEVGCGPGISFREFPFWFRIDHIFHSDHLRALDVEMNSKVRHSDHFPILATFQLLPEQ